jgi:helicase MOV-10
LADPSPNDGTEEATAIAFGRHLLANPAIVARCSSKPQFYTEFKSWKAREASNGCVRRGTASGILLKLIRLGTTESAQHGVVRVKGAVGQKIYFGASGMAAVAETLAENRPRIEADKRGIRVTPLALFDSEAIIRRGNLIEKTLTITNENAVPQQLVSCQLMGRGVSEFTVSFPENGTLPLGPGQAVTLRVRCRPVRSGMTRDVLNLNFGPFSIGRYLEVRCGDPDALSDLAPTRPYERRQRRRVPPAQETETVAAPRLAHPEGAPVRPKPAMELPLFYIPPALRQEAESGEAAERLEEGTERIRTLLGGSSAAAGVAAYQKHYQDLLWLEEIQLVEDLHNFDLRDDEATILTPRGGCYALEVRGLSENRPSVLKGDEIKVNFPSEPHRVYRGRVLEIERETVVLSFDSSFRYVAGQRVEVSFVLRRTSLRRFHLGIRGLSTCPGAATLLFPDMNDLEGGRLHPPREVSSAGLRPFNRNLNQEQMAAVSAIVEGEARHVPYIIFGPPGTGKTTTVVEAVLQCVRRVVKKELRVLVCSPTNTAADVLCERLSSGGLSSRLDMLRLMAYSRSRRDIDPIVMRHANWSEAANGFVTPCLEEIKRPRVVVATLATAAKLCCEGLPRGHFDLMFIDESGQAMEPEALAAASTLMGEGGQLVLAGDPKQLGPVIHHGLAKEHGLSTSMLERVMERPIYQKRPEYDTRVLTKLVRNFRAHELLLELPNELFYEGDLLCCGDEMLIRCCEDWEGLPTPQVPLFFDGLVGKDEQEDRSPSWFNADECERVLEHVLDLLRPHNGCATRLTEDDIGVIAPYNKQVQKLKERFKKKNLEKIKVGSTEMFQGQERKVIIISTVRSSEDWVGSDVRHNLGFLDNPKRFNVAITRAQALLIIVGNPLVLRLDPHWGALLRQCVERGAYRGVPLPPMPGSESDVVAASLAADLEQLTLDDEEAAEQLEMPTYE